MKEEALNIFSSLASYLPPPHVTVDLLSSGVCVRCIFRLFGVNGDAYSSPLLTSIALCCFLKVHNGFQDDTDDNRLDSFALKQCSFSKEESEDEQRICIICLGILQFFQLCQDTRASEDSFSIVSFVEKIVNHVKSEGHQIDGFSLEISIPPVIVANENAVRLYMKKKYEHETWFKEKILSEQISLKDALKLSITNSLVKQLGAKSGVSCFLIRLTYTNLEASLNLQSTLGEVHNSKRRQAVAEKVNVSEVVDPLVGSSHVDSSEQLCNKSDAVMLKALSTLDDQTFSMHFELPPTKASKPCQLTTTCYRKAIYIGGRYLKFSRKVSQTRWIIDDERMGEASVEEIVGIPALELCRGDSYKFHAAGREDIDVRMLGSGRPFLVEVSNGRQLPSMVDVLQIAEKINSSDKGYVKVRNLEMVGSEVWNLMREGEAEKQKQYAALVWISRPVLDEDLMTISSIENMEISQRTPVRVLHRRSPLERKRIIHWMKIEKIVGNNHFFLLHLCTQAGTYIKEFVHGDLGRTYPSVGSILECRAEILQLDVTAVKMDIFM
ncbi:hypothetical protein HPP92_014128 [Vanilla planifolia]|uniref:tRNA pseudouridine(55) synthase n=1 Tax=Vanilla planifolia TaxID=51239 RepID=A0A835UUG6_VANPL|nr:hypothetical protein HPP92_014128 [Vanilla planifolia]